MWTKDGKAHREDVDKRYLHKRILDNGEWLLHGHTHSDEMLNGRQIHVGVEALNGEPISEVKLLDIIKKRS